MKKLVIIFIFSLFTADLFATQAEFKMIKELEQMEKAPVPERIVRPKVEYKGQDLRDPFRRPVIKENNRAPGGDKEGRQGEKPGGAEAAEAQPPSLTVQGLVWGGNLPQAIINNKVVKEGDTIQGAQIIAIDKNGVTVSFEQRQYKLSSPAAGAKPSKNP